MASSSDPWSERRQAPHGPVDPSQRSVSEILGTPERPTILPGATPQWPGHEYGNTVPPKPAPIPGVPGAVRRQRAELEALRDDAARQYHAGEAARVQVYANHRKEAAVAQGVWAAAAWLLGELQASPISREAYTYPYTAREVGREETRARDCIERNAWHEVDEDYAAGVLHGLEWATSTEKQRPVPTAA
ncbi:hypothetical protein [Streptomyces sp. NPDC054826]